MKRKALFFILILTVLVSSIQARQVSIYCNNTVPQSELSVNDLKQTLKNKGFDVIVADLENASLVANSIILAPATDNSIAKLLKQSGANSAANPLPEGFSIRKAENGMVFVIGGDAAGVMYGGLELEEQISCGGLKSVVDTDQSPYMSMRGTKFNIPLDVRTPSYSDASDAAQKNIAEMWSFDFWSEYIDNLARYRYNYISLWNMHPFPSMVRVASYPEVALNDIQRSTVDWDENYSLNGRGLDAPGIINNVEVLKKISMDEKIEFWKKVMRYGKDRNVDFYVVTWNIFVYGTDGKYGITDDIDNEITRDYFRKSVEQMFLTYPDLRGIGLTTGENMPDAGTKEKEDWAFDTYGLGVLDASKKQPGRKITLIHRQHQTGALDIADKFKSLINHKDIEFVFSFKYAKAHVYSSIIQPFHHDFVNEIQSRGNLKTIWTLRNDDIYYFRWGAPDFVREFIMNIPYDVSRGYYYGSDQWIWGREFLSKFPEEPRQIEIAKHWYHWMLWGRLGYNPEIDNDRFRAIIGQRFPEADAEKLFDAWQNASMIYPLTTGFHWGPLDFRWYIESGQSQPGPAANPYGFHDINRFITLPPHPGTDNISIPDYVDAVTSGKTPEGTTPIELYKEINALADNALALTGEMDAGNNKELRLTIEDIRIISYLGKYYSSKIEAATELALFRKTTDGKHQQAAIEAARKSAAYWKLYAATASSLHHNPLWTNRVGHVNWQESYSRALFDLTMLGADKKMPSMQLVAGGTLLEAEDAVFEGGSVAHTRKGFSGSGYLQGSRSVEWTYNSAKPGYYMLDYGYILKRGSLASAKLTVNGKTAGTVSFWHSGDSGNWIWDRIILKLAGGENKIILGQCEEVLVDYLNIIPWTLK